MEDVFYFLYVYRNKYLIKSINSRESTSLNFSTNGCDNFISGWGLGDLSPKYFLAYAKK